MRRLVLGLLAVGLSSLLNAQPVGFPSNIGTPDGILCSSAVAVVSPSDTNENVQATCSIPAGSLGPNGVFRVTANWSLTSSGNNKTLRIRFGGAASTIVASAVYTTQSNVEFYSTTSNRATQTSQYTMGVAYAGITAGSGFTTSTINTALAQPITLSCQKATAGETCTLESFVVEIMPRQ